MMNDKDLEILAKKITKIELDLAESYSPESILEIENLIKNLTLRDLEILDEKIQRKMATYGQM